eukprot:365554-Chlamydomonas_euryale.AAC.32
MLSARSDAADCATLSVRPSRRLQTSATSGEAAGAGGGSDAPKDRYPRLREAASSSRAPPPRAPVPRASPSRASEQTTAWPRRPPALLLALLLALLPVVPPCSVALVAPASENGNGVQ